ncbi:MAG: hypothetical protein LRS46_03140, partial [Desulfurococcales archaeon]|nr:hypothetical protein [Desulfurococcales archaeon]
MNIGWAPQTLHSPRASPRRPHTIAMAAITVVILVTLLSSPASAQPAAGSRFTYRVTVKTRATGNLVGVPINTTVNCTYNVILQVVRVNSSYIVFLVEVKGLNCTSSGPAAAYALNLTPLNVIGAPSPSNLEVPLTSSFNPGIVKFYVNPASLPSGGVYRGGATRNGARLTYRYLYDVETGMLKSASIEAEGYGGLGVSIVQNVNVDLLKSEITGLYGHAGRGAVKWVEESIAILLIGITA